MDLNFAILGTSKIASVHLRNLRTLGATAVSLVYSRNQHRAAAFATATGLATYTCELDNLLEDDTIDAVLVATEPERHVDLARQCMAAGKHVLIEKPLDLDLTKAKSFADEMAAYDVVVSVISQLRFDPALKQMRSLLEHNKGHRPLLATLTMVRRRDEEYFADGSVWRRTAGSVFLNQGIHWLDVLNWFFGIPVNVQATSRTTRPFLSCADQTAAVIDYDDRVSVSLVGSTFGDRNHDDRFTLFSPFDMLDYQTFRSRYDGRWMQNRWLRKIFRTRSYDAELLIHQAANFVNAIRLGNSPSTTVDDAISNMVLAHQLSANGIA